MPNAQETSGWVPGSNVEDKIQLPNNDGSNSSDEEEGCNGHEQLVHHEVEARVQRGHGGVWAGGGDRGGELSPKHPSLGQRCSFGRNLQVPWSHLFTDINLRHKLDSSRLKCGFCRGGVDDGTDGTTHPGNQEETSTIHLSLLNVQVYLCDK